MEKNEGIYAASLILGIFTFVFGAIPFLGIILATIALIIAIKARKKIKEQNEENGIVMAGVVLTIIGFVISIVSTLVVTIIIINNVVSSNNKIINEGKKSNEQNISNTVENTVIQDTTTTIEEVISNNEEIIAPIATIEVEGYGTIKLELYYNMAPNTVKNFIALANRGFYDGLNFHMTIPEFIIQGGDPNGNGTGSAKLSDIGKTSAEEYGIKGEFKSNGYAKNTLKHERGVVSMARSNYSEFPELQDKYYNSASSQFFIMTGDHEALDGLYAAFGKVTEGMDIVDRISKVEVETRDYTDYDLTPNKPLNPPVITKIRVDTHGVDYGLPETIEQFDYHAYLTEIANQYYNNQ